MATPELMTAHERDLLLLGIASGIVELLRLQVADGVHRPTLPVGTPFEIVDLTTARIVRNTLASFVAAKVQTP